MNIHGSFTGGNIEVVQITGDEVFLRNQIRDTMEDWFYWAFCVEGAQGRTLTFHFDKPWLGYYGPAVSHDLDAWRWLQDQASEGASDTFTYAFGQQEERVYFAHNMLYHPRQFQAFCARSGQQAQALCPAETGGSVPCLTFGEGPETILLTARHHACEATGNYILEGVLEELLRQGMPGFKVVAVPFVDYDGVVRGDQGKSRRPWDHNRDYGQETPAIYKTVAAIREVAAREKVRYAFDFHSPWHLGGENDCVFIPRKHNASIKSEMRFARLFEKAITGSALPYDPAHTFPADYKWNSSQTPCFGNYMFWSAGAELAFTLETPYFRASGRPFSQEAARETGRCFARALRQYHTREAKLSFTGDILYQQPMNDLCRAGEGYDFTPLLAGAEHRLADADYLVGNVESPFAGESCGGYTHQRYCFNTPDAALDALKAAGFDLLTLANNHCMDRGQEGLLATLDACQRAGLQHTGTYRTPQEREEPFVQEVRGIRVAFVNATYGTNAFAHHQFLEEGKGFMVRMTQPEETREGAIHLLDPPEEIAAHVQELYCPPQPDVDAFLKSLERDVRRARERADYVVMLLHSGGQYNTLPDAYTEMLAQKLREYGADIVIVNHPHILLPSALRDGHFTAYCLGNLVSAVPGDTIPCPVDPDFSAVLNLYLRRGPSGQVEAHLTFRLCQLVFEDPQKPPRVMDTFDRWKACPTEEYRELILQYANHFMPGMGYSTPQAEYAIF